MTTRPAHSNLVFVAGVAHCGSTLLGRMLDMHPRVVCVGEMARIDRCLKKDDRCGCGATLFECQFWSPFLPELENLSGYDFRRFSPSVYERIRERCDTNVIVDLSKTRVYRMTRRWRDEGEKYAFLIRDPRGVMASAIRGGKDLDSSLRKCKKWLSRLHRFLRKKGERVLRIYYEDLVTSPETELRRICEFIGLQFAPEMLRPSDKIHHFVSSSTSDYMKDSNDIRLDERWRSALTADQIHRIERVIGRVEFLRNRYEGV